MSDQGTVSTEDTPQARNSIAVVTEENQGDIPQDPSHAAPANGTPADTPVASQTSDSGETDKTKSGDDQGKPQSNSKRREQRRSRALQKKLEASEATNQQLTQQLTETNARLDGIEARLQPAAAAKPKLADFDDEDTFFTAMQTWKASQAPATRAPATTQTPAPAPKGDAPLDEDRDKLFAAGKEQFGDEFMEVMANTDDPVPISAHMAEFIFDSEAGPGLVMWADEHREEAQKIYNMGPVRAARALDKIEASLIQASQEAPPAGTPGVETGEQRGLPPSQQPPTSRKVSNAPPPSGGVPASQTPPVNGVTAGMDMESYAATRRAQERRDKGILR